MAGFPQADTERQEEEASRLDELIAEVERLNRLRDFDTSAIPLPKGLMLEYTRLDGMWQQLVRERDAARAEAKRLRGLLGRLREKAYSFGHADDCPGGRHEECGSSQTEAETWECQEGEDEDACRAHDCECVIGDFRKIADEYTKLASA